MVLVAALAGAHCAQAENAPTVPLRRLSLGEIGGWIEVVVRVDGQVGRWLIDTGSTRHLVSGAFADRHRLAAGQAVRANTALGSLAGTEVRLPSLWLGTHEMVGQTAVRVSDLGALVGAAGEGLDGILGVPLLKGVMLDLDLQRWTLALSTPPSGDCPTGTLNLPLSTHRGLPVIDLHIEADPAEPLLLDTGNPAAVVRLAADAAGAELPGLPLPGGATLALAGRVNIGEWQRDLVPVMRLQAPALQRALAPKVVGLAGTALLDGTRWQIDLDRGRACVDPDAPALPGGFGLTLVRRDGQLQVESVLQGGPASAAGVRPGEAVHVWAGGSATGPLNELWARVQGADELALQLGTPARLIQLRRTHFLPRLR